MNRLTLSRILSDYVKDSGLPQPWSRIVSDVVPEDALQDGCIGTTELLTQRGGVPAEALRPGDQLVGLQSFGLIRVRRSHSHGSIVRAVRIRAGALAPDCPQTDVVVGPDQRIVFRQDDGALMALDASALVNGATVLSEAAANITLWRIELEPGNADVVLANGLPVATRGGGIDDAPASAFVGARRQVLERASALGWHFADDPELVIAFAGQVLSPSRRDGSTLSFDLPEGEGIARLQSRSSAPIEIEAPSSDRRRLGVAVAHIALDGTEIALDDDRLEFGFHGVEADGDRHWRWTNGDAALRVQGPGTLDVSVIFAARCWRRPGRRALMVRHPTKASDHYQPFMRWLEANFPAVHASFDVEFLPVQRTVADYALVVPWLQDPVQQWSPIAFQQACELAEACERSGVAVINHPTELVKSAKSTAASLLAAIGVRAPRAFPVHQGDLAEGLKSLGGPVLIREDWGHYGHSHRLHASDPAWRHIIERFQRPVAIEFVETVSPDGLYRKYRYLAAGDFGISVHMLASPEWEVRIANRIISPELIAEDREYIGAMDVNHHVFQQARRLLGLDFVAFDYSYDADGQMIVWEANPFPAMSFVYDEPELAYRDMAIHRFFGAMAGLYLDRTGLPVPAEIEALRVYDAPDMDAVFARLKRY